MYDQHITNENYSDMFKRKTKKFNLIVDIIIVVLFSALALAAVKCDFLYSTNIFGVKSNKADTFSTEAGSRYSGEKFNADIRNFSIDGSSISAEVELTNLTNKTAVYTASDIVLIKYTDNGRDRERSYFRNDEREFTAAPGESCIINVNYSIVDLSYDNSDTTYCIRVNCYPLEETVNFICYNSQKSC